MNEKRLLLKKEGKKYLQLKEREKFLNLVDLSLEDIKCGRVHKL